MLTEIFQVTRVKVHLSKFKKQEAQLSQRDRAMLRVTVYFAKSLKVIRNDTEKGVSIY